MKKLCKCFPTSSSLLRFELISLLNLKKKTIYFLTVLLKFWNTLRYKTNIRSRSLFIIQYPNELELFYNKKGAHMNAPGTDWSDWGTP